MARQSSGEGPADLECRVLNQVSPDAFDTKDLCLARRCFPLAFHPSQ